jgi:TatD DNase family protein
MVNSVDINHMLVETDSPYLTPEEKRGEKNTSLNLKFIIGKLSEQLDMKEDEVIKITTENARELFKI